MGNQFCAHEEEETPDDQIVPANNLSFWEDLVKDVGSNIFIEESTRKGFVTEQAKTLENLITGKLTGRNDFRRALLGRKGVGKTWLLKAIQSACNNLNLKRFGLLLVYLDDENSSKLTPVDAIVQQLPVRFQKIVNPELASSHTPVTILANFLQKHGYYVFGIFDEFHNVFRISSMDHAKEVVRQLSSIGDNTSGIFHWILSGSSTYLRKIITAKLEDTKGFPYYTNMDLNGTKFQFRSIFPFLDREDFLQYLKFIKSPNKDIYNLYISTGGVARLLAGVASEVACESPNPDYAAKSKGTFHSHPVNGPQDSTTVLFRSIAVALDLEDRLNPTNTNSDLFDEAVSWTTLVRKGIVETSFDQLYKGAERLNFTVLCYDLADKGHIRYLDKSEMIGFMSPYIFCEVFTGAVRLRLEEAMALRTGNQVVGSSKEKDLAGDVTLRLIAIAASKSPQIFNMKVEYDPTISTLPELNLSRIDQTLVQKMCKEVIGTGGSGKGNDAAGGDGIVVNIDEDSKVIVLHRIQVKIYVDLKHSDAEKVCQRFSTMEKQVEKCFAIFPEYTVQQRFILATTGNIRPIDDAEKCLKEKGVTIWGKKFLADNVWTEDIKYLGKKFKK
jgi:hypothetical protein